MNRLKIEDRARIVNCLVEGCSMRSTTRLTGAAKKTVARTLVEVGEACASYHDKIMRNLPCKVLQVDEVWSFTYCIGARKRKITGNPDRSLISTSYVERQNLTLRMSNRRFTRLTNGFSKKIENHKHMMAIHMMHYNFCRIHQTLRVTPAMEAGITDHVWSLGEVLDLAINKSDKKISDCAVSGV